MSSQSHNVTTWLRMSRIFFCVFSDLLSYIWLHLLDLMPAGVTSASRDGQLGLELTTGYFKEEIEPRLKC